MNECVNAQTDEEETNEHLHRGFVKESGHLRAEKRQGQLRQQEQHKPKYRDMKEEAAWNGRGVAATLRRPTLGDISQMSHYRLLGK